MSYVYNDINEHEIKHKTEALNIFKHCDEMIVSKHMACKCQQ